MNSSRTATKSGEASKRAAAQPAKRRPGRPSLSDEELLDKALDLFLEHGFERTSIDAITSAAGMAKRTVYLRYGDKETLFRAALERAIEEWILPLEALQAVETDDLETTLLAIGRVLVANLMTPSGLRLFRITNAESGRMPEIGAFTYRHGTERTITYLAELFRRRLGASALSKDDARQAAIAFLFLVVSGPPTVTAWGMKLEANEIDRHTEYNVRLFLHGLLPAQGEAGKVSSKTARSKRAAASDPKVDEDLRRENERLRKLLLEAMLEADRLREKLGDS